MTSSPEWTIAAAASALKQGALTAEALTDQYLQHIAKWNPSINALRSVQAEQALKDARHIDAARAQGLPLPALAGIPIVTKENCDVAGVVCSAGLSFQKQRIASDDAAITRLLKQQGAIIVGVSISDPGAFSVRTAEVNHPADPSLTVGGSSGGSAAALAAGMCLGAIGSDTGGSIRIPSACCGTVGLKPTFNAGLMGGIFPLVPSLDHVGPMAGTLADLKSLWDVMSDRTVRRVRASKGMGYDPRWLEQADKAVRNNFDIACEKMKSKNFTLVECQLPALDKIGAMHGTIFLVESLAYHKENYGVHLHEYPDIAREWFQVAHNITSDAYNDACHQRKQFTNNVTNILNEVEALMLPTLPLSRVNKSAKTLNVAGEDMDYTMALVRFTSLFNHTGHPVLALPVANTDDVLAANIQLVGRHNSEDSLLKLALALDQ